MINGNLEDFLFNGWYSEATLYLNGYTYWCEGVYSTKSGEELFYFWVYRYRSVIHTRGNEIWTKRLIKDHDVVDYSTVFETCGKNEDEVKPKFFSAKIFDGKTFWEVEKEIAWYDEY